MWQTAKGFGVITLVALATLLAACGGGGSDSSSLAMPTPSATSTPTPIVWPSTGKTKVDATGQALPSTATSWSCVRDNANGLMWEVKNTTDVVNLRYYKNGYTNYDSTAAAQYWNGSAYVNPTQTQIDAATNSVGFKTAVNAQGLCGATDWRLPTKDELAGLLTATATAGKYIDTGYFPDVDVNRTNNYATYGIFWSSSSDPNYAYNAWYVDFVNYYVYNYLRYNTFAVRLVRASP